MVRLVGIINLLAPACAATNDGKPASTKMSQRRGEVVAAVQRCKVESPRTDGRYSG
jgi:hypothetical protein